MLKGGESMKTSKISIALFSVFALLALALEGDAATSVRVQCEKRGTTRSKISVDGRGLRAGFYTAHVKSGSNEANSEEAVKAVRGEAEFDFDSNRNDIAAGATAIDPDFIEGTPVMVTGEILNQAGVVVASATVGCRVR